MSETILTRTPSPTDLRLHYGPAPQQFADLRLPPGPGPHPCVIAIHGGFWRARYDLAHLGHLCAALATAGIATWNIEYRRVGNPGGGWPGTFHDIAAAARYLFTVAPEHGIDPNRVVLAGHSAGGHLALWLAGLARVPPTSAIHRIHLPLRGAIALAGVLDLRRAWELGLSDGAVGSFVGGSPAEMPERYAAASPIELLPLGVPQLVIHGANDDDVPVEISETYHAAAIATGDDANLVTLPATGHFELIDPAAPQWPSILSAMHPFLG